MDLRCPACDYKDAKNRLLEAELKASKDINNELRKKLKQVEDRLDDFRRRLDESYKSP